MIHFLQFFLSMSVRDRLLLSMLVRDTQRLINFVHKSWASLNSPIIYKRSLGKTLVNKFIKLLSFLTFWTCSVHFSLLKVLPFLSLEALNSFLKANQSTNLQCWLEWTSPFLSFIKKILLFWRVEKLGYQIQNCLWTLVRFWWILHNSQIWISNLKPSPKLHSYSSGFSILLCSCLIGG